MVPLWEAQLRQRRASPRSSTASGSSVGDRQQGGEEPDVLLEEVEDRGDPALAEPHPGPHPWTLSPSLRVSVACSNSGIRGLAPELLPSRYGELAATATCTAAIAWEAFQYAANWSGEVCTWNCVLVHAASGRSSPRWSAAARPRWRW